MSTKKNSAVKTGTVKKKLFLLLPVIILTTVFLFCVRGRIVPAYVSDQFWYLGEEYTGDLYAYFRMQVFVLLTVVFTFYMVCMAFAGKVKIKKHKIYIPMLIYVVMVLVSYACSEWKNIALLGYLGRYEGTVTLICYMAILFYSMNAVRTEENVKLVVKCFTIACVILGVWGVLQFLGIRTDDLPAWLYLPAEIREFGSVGAGQETGAVTWFFGNQNYTSFFMIFPICVFAMMCIAQEDMQKKVLYAALTGLMLFSLWQAASLGGMVGLAVTVVVAFLCAGAENLKKWGKSLGLLVLAAVISMGASLPTIMREVQSGADTSNLLGLEEVYAAEYNAEFNEDALHFSEIDYIQTEGKNIVFAFEEMEVCISTENGKVVAVTDEAGKDIPAGTGLLHVTGYVDEGSGYDLVEVNTANNKWVFIVLDNETYYVSPSGKGVKLDKVERIGFEGDEDFATNRGYIWSRTLPLIKETFLFGYGADTFAIYYPQNDYAGLHNIGYFGNGKYIIIDKPHNMYLGAAVNTGVISMIALIAIYVIYLLESVKVYRKHIFAGMKDYVGMGIFIAVAGFMVSGLVNDSTVQMMPVVYVLLGMGFAINRMLKEK